MLISLNWLQRYVDLSDLTPERIADDLTLTTAETEGIHAFGEALSQIVVAKVVECGPHPEADKLSVTQVDAGTGELLQIVCGAPNVAKGQTVSVILPGRRLPDGTKIKKGKLRGQVSHGMICSERELGLSDEHQGILVLETELPPGTPLTEALPVRDFLIEIDNKSINHRPDLWGHYGFARELAAIYGRPLADPLQGLHLEIPSEGESLDLRIDVPSEACPRYLGAIANKIRIQTSPDWMRYLLVAVGQRPINNLVDLTNFLMLDLGQPMHAFDRRRIRGDKIRVRFAREGESMRTLDGEERSLQGGDLLICDAQGPVALAGIMGGENSMVSEETQSLFLESANFHAATVRRTSARLGLRTDSSARFEKSLDPSLAELAARKFLALLPEVSPGAVLAGPLQDPAHWSYEPKVVPLRPARASRILGIPLDEAGIRGYLEPLGFELEKGREGALEVKVPSWRATKDIGIEEDLIEELGRSYRYDNIPEEAPLRRVQAPYQDPELWTLRKIRHILAEDCALSEVYNYSFLNEELCARLGLADLAYAEVTNAIAAHYTRLRRDLLPGLLGSLALNLGQQDEVALFECGKAYRPDEPGETRTDPETGETRTLPREVHQVVAVLARRGRGAAYQDLRGKLEHLLRRLGRPSYQSRLLENPPSWMHPGRSAAFYSEESNASEVPFAYVGELHPKVLQSLDLELGDNQAAAFCLDLRALLALSEQKLQYRPVPKFPEQPVDLAFLAPEELQVAALARLLEEANPKLVQEVHLFEVYRGKGLPEGKKSLNFTVTLCSPKRTLDSKDEERYINRVRTLAQSLGADLRG
ncbi:MAG TPA: phenylalanine--tRNA ligase subunit beta [Planctomycetes bacterium]|nr:phenylalanine--tRNA ligase subunit beta [Planctomycetota bacterium]